jgi:hypothetical protein
VDVTNWKITWTKEKEEKTKKKLEDEKIIEDNPPQTSNAR